MTAIGIYQITPKLTKKMLKYPYLFILIFMLLPFLGQAQVTPADSNALIQFAQAFGGIDPNERPIVGSWNSISFLPANEIWDPNVPVSNWHGVGLSSAGEVIEIDLSGLPLVMPTAGNYSLNNFADLERLFIDSCNLVGSFPPSMFLGLSAPLSVVDISNNQLFYDSLFYGNNFASLLDLEELYSRKAFSNPSPLFFFYPFQGQNLTILDISDNRFRGQIDLSSAMASLENLSAKDNSFTGIINSDSADYLHFLSISNNAMTNSGHIEALLENCPLSRLEAKAAMDSVVGAPHPFPNPAPAYTPSGLHLNLSHNHFIGTANLDKLVDQTTAIYINLSHNKLDSLYPLQSNINHLEYLDLSHNMISCRLNQDFLMPYQKIEELRLNNNDFYGPLNGFPDNTAELIEILDLSGNPRLVGTFPLEDFLTAQDSPAPLRKFDISNCNFKKLQPTSGTSMILVS